MIRQMIISFSRRTLLHGASYNAHEKVKPDNAILNFFAACILPIAVLEPDGGRHET
jgi:hypothetical protein